MRLRTVVETVASDNPVNWASLFCGDGSTITARITRARFWSFAEVACRSSRALIKIPSEPSHEEFNMNIGSIHPTPLAVH
jgi:hypothetical protein